MDTIQKTWKTLYPDNIFEYFFYDDFFDQMYRSAADIRTLLTYGTLFAIIVSCLGLAGLSLFTIQTRIQEIGIRKVMGGTMSGIVVLLSKDFFKLILIANIFAWPFAWLAMRQWLQNYAYRIDLQLWMFVLAGFIALVIAMMTVSFQAWRAAVANPVATLRYE